MVVAVAAAALEWFPTVESIALFGFCSQVDINQGRLRNLPEVEAVVGALLGKVERRKVAGGPVQRRPPKARNHSIS